VTALAAGLLAPGSGSAQPPPLVEATFHVDPASQLATKLPPAQLRFAQERLSKLLAELCATHFGFVRWRWVRPGQPVDRGVPRLTLRLRDVLKEGNKEITLGFVKTVDRREEPIPLLGPFTLVEWWKPNRPATENALYELVAAKLDGAEGLFAGDTFRTRLHNWFLKGIPLAREVLPIAGERTVVVPLRWDAVRAASASILEVRFVSRCTPTQPAPGVMRLSLVAKRVNPQYLGFMESAITLFHCAALTLEGTGAWSDEIPGLFEKSAVSETNVYMDTYVPALDTGTADGLVIDPN
jgi:hypothetical protein